MKSKETCSYSKYSEKNIRRSTMFIIRAPAVPFSEDISEDQFIFKKRTVIQIPTCNNMTKCWRIPWRSSMLGWPWTRVRTSTTSTSSNICTSLVLLHSVFNLDSTRTQQKKTVQKLLPFLSVTLVKSNLRLKGISVGKYLLIDKWGAVTIFLQEYLNFPVRDL